MRSGKKKKAKNKNDKNGGAVNMDICEHCTEDVKPGQWYLKTDTGVMHIGCAKKEGLIERAK